VERTWTTGLAERAGESVRLQGWLHHFRRLSNVSFLLVRDARGVAQVVVDDPDLAASLDGLDRESVLEVEGVVATEAQAPGGAELTRPRVRVLSEAVAPPIDLYRPRLGAQLPTLLDHAAVSLRHPTRQDLFRLGSASMAGFRAALLARDFVEVQTPKLVAGATESGATVFPVEYFGRRAYLAQSPQLYKQMMVGVFERVFEIGPVFRAEPHDTPRHLNEYVSLDAEMGFIEDHRTVISLLRDAVAGMVEAMAEEGDALRRLRLELPEIPSEVPVIHFTDALALISRETGEDVTGEPDLAPAHEAWLGRWARTHHGSDLLAVSGYPMAKRPFYTHPDPARPGFSNSFDMLFRGLELATGGQRLHRYDDYLAALAARGEEPEPLEGYLAAFRHGMPPHGGFGMGLARWLARVAGIANLRETELFPRDRTRLSP
jgi:nondiscriminating aspartyl-tRNA synthetase